MDKIKLKESVRRLAIAAILSFTVGNAVLFSQPQFSFGPSIGFVSIILGLLVWGLIAFLFFWVILIVGHYIIVGISHIKKFRRKDFNDSRKHS